MLGAILGTIAIVLAVVALGLFIDRKRPILPRPQDLAPPPKRPAAQHRLGEAPATAIRAGEAQMTKLRTGQRCPLCRTELSYAGDADDVVRYNDRDMLVLHFACSRCSAKKTLYVEPCRGA